MTILEQAFNDISLLYLDMYKPVYLYEAFFNLTKKYQSLNLTNIVFRTFKSLDTMGLGVIYIYLDHSSHTTV